MNSNHYSHEIPYRQAFLAKPLIEVMGYWSEVYMLGYMIDNLNQHASITFRLRNPADLQQIVSRANLELIELEKAYDARKRMKVLEKCGL